jgi:hypothetical protein
MSKDTKNKPIEEEDPNRDEERDEDEDEDEDEDAEKKGAKDASGRDAGGDDKEEDEDEDEDEDDDEDDEDEDDAHAHAHGHEDRPTAAAHSGDEDPAWWAPHVVLGVLVLVGVLGFFGLFNKPLGFLAAKPAGGSTTETMTHTATPTPTPTPQQPARPSQPQQGQQPQGEMFGAKHFLVMYKGGMRAPATITRTKEEAKTRAEEALKKVKGGTKFEQIVAEYSDEPGAGARGGDLGMFRKGQMVGPFQEAVEKLKVNEVSGLVETPFGYHVILRTK